MQYIDIKLIAETVSADFTLKSYNYLLGYYDMVPVNVYNTKAANHKNVQLAHSRVIFARMSLMCLQGLAVFTNLSCNYKYIIHERDIKNIESLYNL